MISLEQCYSKESPFVLSNSTFLVQFEKQANEVVAALPWVQNVKVTMSAQPAKQIYSAQLPPGLQTISNIIAVSSCKVTSKFTPSEVILFLDNFFFL